MRSRLVAGCLAGALLAAPSTPASAASVIPPESGFELPSGARSAIVGDVNGDGVRELVRILRWQNDPGRLAVEVTSVDAAGRVSSGGQVVLRRAASPDDVFAGGPQPDRDGMLVVGVTEPARLLTWRVEGVEHVIVAGIGTEGVPRPCCLTLWEVGLGPSALRRNVGDTELRLLVDTQRSASSIYTIDLDGDGTDEVVVGESLDALRPNEVTVAVLRWDGRAFDMTSRFLTPALGVNLVPLGDSDGQPGEELGLVAVPNEANAPALLHRLSWADGAPRTELGGLPFLGEPVPMRGSSGGRIVMASPGSGLALLAWSSGDEINVEASSPQRGVPLGVLGAGDDARLLLRDGGTVRLLDERFGEQGTIERSEAASRFRNTPLAPYAGALPGGLANGSPAIVFRGRIATLDGSAVMASLPGMTPIGLFGPGNAWAALAGSIGFEAGRVGGRLAPAGPIEPVRITIAPTEEVLSPETDGGVLDPAVSGAIPDPRSSNRQVLLTRDSFSFEFASPGASLVALSNGDLADVQRQTVGPSGIVRLDVTGPSANETGDEPFTADLQVVTPAGHGYVSRWDVRILREPPPLETTTPVAPLSFSVPLRGRTDPGAAVVVDGTPVAVRADGSFDVQVSAGPIPRDVQIQVTDAVGNSARYTISVVGVVDFRRLPWIPVVAILTVLAGAVLYLRVPRPGRPAARATGDDATFEEID